MGIGKPFRLRVDSSFGDGDCGEGEIHTRAPEISRRREERRFSRVTSPRNISLTRVCISPAPQSPSPKLETTHSLQTVRKLDSNGLVSHRKRR